MKMLLVIFPIVLVVSFFIAANFGYLNVHRIDCFTQFGSCPQDYLDRVQFLYNYPIYHPLPRTDLKQKFDSLPEIKAINFYRHLPSTVIVKVELRQPIGVVTLPVLGAQAVVDDQGVIFNSITNTLLPSLVLSQDQIDIGNQISNLQLTALLRLNFISSLLGSRITGTLHDSQLTVFLRPATTIIIDITKSPGDWAPSLQSIFVRSKIDGKIPRKIDLRFSSAIVTY